MKSATIATMAAMAATTFGQTLSGVDSLAPCGVTCITNMVSSEKTGELHCGATDYSCLCLSPDFSYGIRDCTNAVCQNHADAVAAQSWATSFCASYGVAVTTTGQKLVPTKTGPAVTTASAPSSIVIPGLTSSFTTVVSSGSVIITSTGVISAPGITSTLSGTGSKETASMTTAVETTTQTTGTGGSTGGSTNTPSSTDSSDPAPRATAAPVGILAAVGIAALLL